MPIVDCTSSGKPGKKFGESGFCFTGPDAEEKAGAQGRAIKADQGNSGHLKEKDKR